MTKRKVRTQNKKLGSLLKNYRLNLTDIPNSRQKFIENRAKTFFAEEEWISEKTLTNYENGKNIPNLQMIKKLALALEIDSLDLIREMLKLI